MRKVATKTLRELLVIAVLVLTVCTSGYGQMNDEINLLGVTEDQGTGTGTSKWSNFLSGFGNTDTVVNQTAQQAPTQADTAAATEKASKGIFGFIGKILNMFTGASMGGANVSMNAQAPQQSQVASNTNSGSTGFWGFIKNLFSGNKSANVASVPSAPAGNSFTGNSSSPASPASQGTATNASDGGLNVPLYAQPDGRTCGPTSLKMAMEYYGIQSTVAENSRGVLGEGGASHQGMLDKLHSNGLTGSTMDYGVSLSWIKQQTDSGKPVLASVRGNYGPRSTNGHIVCIVGVTASGNVIINDSAGGRRVECNGSTFMRANSGRMAISVSR
jgi:uncharacterized protein YvpB